MSKRQILITSIIFVAVVLTAVILFFLKEDSSGKILLPYIAHQKPNVDPHLPNSVPLSDKLDEVEFDGLFNISANQSGIIYEDGLGELLEIDSENIVYIKLKTNKKWHSSYEVELEDEEITIKDSKEEWFSADDLKFTLNRIASLGSLSPDFILVSQAISDMSFAGPDENDVIKFNFKDDRIWTEPDIKEVLSFKIIKAGSTTKFNNGTSNYISIESESAVQLYYKSPDGYAGIPNINLMPFIDNSTFTTELKNNSINVLLETPYGSLSPILDLEEDFFVKSKISTTFFAIIFNTERLNRVERKEVRKLLDNEKILERFFKIGSPQQREIIDYLGNRNKHFEYLNKSIFPSSSYYVEEQIVMPHEDLEQLDNSKLPDTIRIRTCLNFGYREELSELVEILKDPSLSQGRIRVSAVQNDQILRGNYDAVLLPFTGYRSNFLFDLYNVFLREPDLETYKINLITRKDSQGETVIDPSSFNGQNNFFRLDSDRDDRDRQDVEKLLKYIYRFMATQEIGDKQAYAERIDRLENEMALGIWLFSLPSISYFSTQFDSTSIDLYGTASQLSTIEKWREKSD